MDLGEIKDEYRARVEPRWKSISEILEEAAKETKAYKDLEEENKKPKDKIEHLEFDIEAWKKLKAVWEKKEQELQRENDKLKIHIEAKDKAYMDLLADYNYLKARIKKTERAFIKYKEKLEKLEVDLDMVVMNR